jgi:hypothetical protein
MVDSQKDLEHGLLAIVILPLSIWIGPSAETSATLPLGGIVALFFECR